MGLTDDDSMSILPQGKTGSMMDVQSLPYERVNIGSDNEHILDPQPSAEHDNNLVRGSEQCQPSTVSTTTSGLQGAESPLTRT